MIGLVALFRWRAGEGRALGALTLVPVSAMPYDLLLIHLCARTTSESWALTVAGWLTFLVLIISGPHDLVRPWTLGHFIIALGVVAPATIIVLRQRRAASESPPS